jgi:hypothetical protein
MIAIDNLLKRILSENRQLILKKMCTVLMLWLVTGKRGSRYNITEIYMYTNNSIGDLPSNNL